MQSSSAWQQKKILSPILRETFANALSMLLQDHSHKNRLLDSIPETLIRMDLE